MATKVHKVRFYNPKPEAINCVSLNKFQKQIALARFDASIEIWDLNRAPYLVRFIPGVENGSVEALGWVHNRLLSTGLSGALVEWDIARLCQKTTVLLTGYAAWCLDVNSANTLVAVGTEQGYVNLYSVEDDEIVYKRLFDKQDGRIMCCKFDNTGNILVTGSTDTIRVWNVETGHAVTRISVSRRQKEVIVWSLAVLSDNVIVSGDSLGRLTFWDGTMGEQIDSYTTHKADILAIAVSEDESKIYCSGIDPTISHFVKVSKGKGAHSGSQWVKNVQIHIHEHDVRDLVCNGETLVSVGVDGYLTLSSYPPKWVMRVPPMIPIKRSSVCPEKKLLLLRYKSHLEVWKLGSHARTENGELEFSNINLTSETEDNIQSSINRAPGNEKHRLKLTENPLKLVSVKAKHKRQIQCCEIAPSGEFFVYATDIDIRILKLEIDDLEEDQTNISLSKVLISGISSPCDHIAITEDSRRMVVHCGNVLHVLIVDLQAGATVVQTLPIDKFLKTTAVLHLIVSKKTASGATYIVVADTSGVVEVMVERKKFVHYVTLPKYQCVPTALTIDSERDTLIVVYTDQKIVEYDLVKKRFTEWPGSSLPPQWLTRRSATAAVAVHPRRNALLLHDDTSLWVLERSALVDEEEPEAKRKPEARKPFSFNVIPIKYLAGFHWLGEDEAVMLEILPENIVSQLPPPVQVNRWQNKA